MKSPNGEWAITVYMYIHNDILPCTVLSSTSIVCCKWALHVMQAYLASQSIQDNPRGMQMVAYDYINCKDYNSRQKPSVTTRTTGSLSPIAPAIILHES